MTGKGKRRGGEREEGARRSRSRANDNDDSSDGEKEPEKPPPFVLSGDNTGSGIDYNTLDEGSWKTLHDYCQVRWCSAVIGIDTSSNNYGMCDPN